MGQGKAADPQGGARPPGGLAFRGSVMSLLLQPAGPGFSGRGHPEIPTVPGDMPEGSLPRKGQVWEGLLSPPMKAWKKNKRRDLLLESPNFTTVTQSTNPPSPPSGFQ